MFDLKKFLEAGIAQINPFDGGKDWNSVQRQPSRAQPAQTPAPARRASPGQTMTAAQRGQVVQRAMSKPQPWAIQQPQVQRVQITKPKVELPRPAVKGANNQPNVVDQVGKFLFSNAGKLANTGIATIGAVADASTVVDAALRGGDVEGANQRAVQTLNKRLRDPGLFKAGTFFNDTDDAALNGDIGAFGRKVAGAGAGTALEVAPALRGTQVLSAGMAARQAVPRLAAEGVAYGTGAEGAQQLQEGQFNPLDLALSGGAGAALGPAVYGAGKLGVEATKRGAQAFSRPQTTKSQVLDDIIERASNPSPATRVDQPPLTAQPRAAVTPAPIRERGFAQSVQSSDEVTDTLKQSRNFTQSYQVRDTAQLAAAADTYARKPIKRVQREVNERLAGDLGTLDDKTIAESIAVAKRLDDEGDFDGANQIYERLAEHGTKGGQAIQAFSLLSNRTPEGMRFYAARTLKKHGVTLDKARQDQLKALIANVKKTKADTEERKMATYQVTQFVNEQVPSGAASKAVNLWRAGLLTAPTTSAGNLLGNTTEAATRNLWTNPVATGADALMSLVTGKRTKTMAGGNIEGAREGIDKLKTFLKTGYDERNPLDKFDVGQVTYGQGKAGRAAKTYTDSVYRLMGAADQPFYYAAKNQALKDIAGAEALNQGLKGADKSAFIENFIKNPPRKADDAATESAKSAVYQNKTGLGEFVSGGKQRVRQYNQGAGALADAVMPFTQVPASVAMRVLDRMGVGFARELWKFTPWSKGKFDQRKMAEAIGNGTFGPAMMTAGYNLAQQGNITFGYPEDPKEADLWKMEGKQPYSVRIGDRWYSLNYMQPFGTLLAMGGQIKDAEDRGEDPSAIVSQGVATAGQSIMNQSFLKGVSGILDAIDDPKRYAENLWENTTGSLTPNLIRAGARSADPVQRDVKGPLEGVLAGIPGLRQTLPTKSDAFGRDLPAKDNFVNQFVNPLRPSKARDDDSVVGELRRLQDAELGILPSRVAKNSLGKEMKLEREDMEGIKRAVGPELYKAWDQVMSDPRYAKLSDDDKAAILKKAKDTVAGAQKAKYAAESGLKDKQAVVDGLTTAQRDYLTGQTPDFLAAEAKDKKTATTKKKSSGRKVASGKKKSTAKGRARAKFKPPTTDYANTSTTKRLAALRKGAKLTRRKAA